MVLFQQPNSPYDDYTSESTHPIFSISTSAVASPVVIQESCSCCYSFYSPIPHSTTLLWSPLIRYSPFRQVPSRVRLSFRNPVAVGTLSTAHFPLQRLCFGSHPSDLLHSDTGSRHLYCRAGLLCLLVPTLQPYFSSDRSVSKSFHRLYLSLPRSLVLLHQSFPPCLIIHGNLIGPLGPIPMAPVQIFHTLAALSLPRHVPHSLHGKS